MHGLGEAWRAEPLCPWQQPALDLEEQELESFILAHFSSFTVFRMILLFYKNIKTLFCCVSKVDKLTDSYFFFISLQTFCKKFFFCH